ncbi:MAG: DUF983 domain-containing protein [Caldilineaceae bacterium]|jgi:uncharacterized protein (DUF983 family)
MAVLLQRCPVCLDGKVFGSFLRTNKDCPVCGIHFERETGYYLSAMFIAYTIGFILIAPLALYLYLAQTPTVRFGLIVGVAIILVWPLIFRYSRVLWLHADQLMDPRSPLRADAQGDAPESQASES